jgi:hypothetical protein
VHTILPGRALYDKNGDALGAAAFVVHQRHTYWRWSSTVKKRLVQIKAIQRHYLSPGSNKVIDERLVAIARGIGFGDCTQLGI